MESAFLVSGVGPGARSQGGEARPAQRVNRPGDWGGGVRVLWSGKSPSPYPADVVPAQGWPGDVAREMLSRG